MPLEKKVIDSVMKKKTIHILYPYPKNEAAAQRFRIEQFIPELEKNYKVKVYPFWSNSAWKILYEKGYIIQKFFGFLGGIARRKLYLLKSIQADYIYILREATPIGPPFIEWILAKVLGKKIIYDFDDAIWLPNQSEVNRGVVKNLKYHKKVGKICSWAYKVSAGNEYLAEYARRFNEDVVVIPTTVDTDKVHNPEWFTIDKPFDPSTKAQGDIQGTDTSQGDVDKYLGIEKPFDPSTKAQGKPAQGDIQGTDTSQGDKHDTIPIIGWTGTHSTIKHLDILWPILDELENEIPFTFHIISDDFPQETRQYVRHIHWNKETEIQDLIRFDIGVMPLIEDEWAKGKCGFKLIQYMALEIASVATDFGVNSEIVENDSQGLLIKDNDPKAWKEALKTLLLDKQLRVQIGVAGRKRIVEAYSKDAVKNRVLELFS